eukprot:1187293-Prorocentrum_minimum.AAC.2
MHHQTNTSLFSTIHAFTRQKQPTNPHTNRRLPFPPYRQIDSPPTPHPAHPSTSGANSKTLKPIPRSAVLRREGGDRLAGERGPLPHARGGGALLQRAAAAGRLSPRGGPRPALPRRLPLFPLGRRREPRRHRPPHQRRV